MEKKLIEYFNGDELAANVWLSKYALEGETHYDQMHIRLAKEFARIEDKYIGEEICGKYLSIENCNPLPQLSEYGQNRKNLNEESIFNLFKDFKYIIPQGSIMYGLGNEGKYISLSNCYYIGRPEDSYGGIMEKDEQLVQLMKRRAGVV